MKAHTQVEVKQDVAPVQAQTPAPFGTLRRKCACGSTGASSASSGECAECKKKKTLQRSAAGNAGPGVAPPIVHQVLRSPGQPLDAATRGFFEPRFAHDFSKVRIHADAQAAESAQSVNALAYAVGNNLVFNTGRFSPSTDAGRRLMAHELAHVVQQRGRGPAHGEVLRIGEPGDPFERNADQLASGIESSPAGLSPVARRALPDTLRTLRRAVTVPPDAASFATTEVPTNDLILSPTLAFAITSDPITFSGTARADCGQGDNASGYELGIVQIETSEVNHATYEGATPADGTIQVILDQPPIRPAGACTDSETGKFWIASSPLTCGQDVTVKRSDTPGRLQFPTSRQNARTGKPNYLKSLKVVFEFLTALMVKRPDQSLQALRWIGWSETWDDSFSVQANGQVQKIGRGGQSTFVRASQSGTPPPELPTRFAVPAQTCNDISIAAGNNPASIVSYGGS